MPLLKCLDYRHLWNSISWPVECVDSICRRLEIGRESSWGAWTVFLPRNKIPRQVFTLPYSHFLVLSASLRKKKRCSHFLVLSASLAHRPILSHHCGGGSGVIASKLILGNWGCWYEVSPVAALKKYFTRCPLGGYIPMCSSYPEPPGFIALPSFSLPVKQKVDAR